MAISEIQTKVRIHCSPEDAFKAITQEELTHYFAMSVTGEPEQGKMWTWHLSEYENFVFEVKEFIPSKILQLGWKPSELEYALTLTFEIESQDTSCLLHIREQGWQEDAFSQLSKIKHAQAWQAFALSLKVWIEHQLDLRH